jgi:hypothetical protein
MFLIRVKNTIRRFIKSLNGVIGSKIPLIILLFCLVLVYFSRDLLGLLSIDQRIIDQGYRDSFSPTMLSLYFTILGILVTLHSQYKQSKKKIVERGMVDEQIKNDAKKME